MKCPKCNRKTNVVDSRLSSDNSVMRRRVCSKECGNDFRTIECTDDILILRQTLRQKLKRILRSL